jgi:hypothetical protein
MIAKTGKTSRSVIYERHLQAALRGRSNTQIPPAETSIQAGLQHAAARTERVARRFLIDDLISKPRTSVARHDEADSCLVRNRSILSLQRCVGRHWKQKSFIFARTISVGRIQELHLNQFSDSSRPVLCA